MHPKSSLHNHIFKSLYWLPVKVRKTYKMACLCYHCHSSTAPSYVTNMQQKISSHSHNTHSSSHTMLFLNRPTHSKATINDYSFSFAFIWNSIQNDITCIPSQQSLKSARRHTCLVQFTKTELILITVHIVHTLTNIFIF